MLSKVTVWHMTEEERLEYIKKHPIRPTKREMVGSFERDQRVEWQWPASRRARKGD